MGIRKRLADALELQHDVALNLPALHLTGGERLLMENHRGLLEFGKTKIRVASSAGIVEIAGENLDIKSVGREDLLVTGNISSIIINRSAVKPT
jgi:sporulation protein YqfC